MLSIRDQRGRTNFLTHTNTEDRNRFVPHESNERRGGYPPKVTHGLRIDELFDRFISSNTSGEEDNKHNDDACNILNTTVAIRISARLSSPDERKCNPKRQRSSSVAKVVNRVGQ